MQLLRDNLTLWTSDMNDSEFQSPFVNGKTQSAKYHLFVRFLDAAGKEEDVPAPAAAPADEVAKAEA